MAKNCKIGEVVLCAACPFTLLMLYLLLSEHASLFTSFLICVGISIPYGVLAKMFVTVRCASAVCIVQVFSHFGLFMVFILWSWITFQEALESVIRLHHDANSAFCTNNTIAVDTAVPTADLEQDEKPDSKTDWLSSKIEGVKTVMVYLHYGGLLPLIGLFVYSYLYERTYTIFRNSSSSASSPSQEQASPSRDAPDPEESSDSITMPVKDLFWLIFRVGFFCTIIVFILCCIYWILTIEHFFYKYALSLDLSETCLEYITNQKMSYWWTTAYILMCLNVFVLSFISWRILKLRGIIINKFKLITDDELSMATGREYVVVQQRSKARAGHRLSPQDENNVTTTPREAR